MKHFQDLSTSVSGLQNLVILVIEIASLNAFKERNKKNCVRGVTLNLLSLKNWQ
jgi:hypothetical protein